MGKEELARYHPAGHGADQADELCAKQEDDPTQVAFNLFQPVLMIVFDGRPQRLDRSRQPGDFRGRVLSRSRYEFGRGGLAPCGIFEVSEWVLQLGHLGVRRRMRGRNITRCST